MEVANALGPVFLLVLLGAALNRAGFPGREFWSGAERVTYYLFFPALIVHELALADFRAADLGQTLVLTIVLIAGATLVLAAAARWIAADGPGFTSVYQGAIRINTYVGLAAAERLWGEPGLALAALAVACMVPLINLACISVFAAKVGGRGPMLRQIVVNPLIVGCVTGLALNLTGVGLPGWLDPLFGLLGAPALPVGLLAVGVGLAPVSLRRAVAPLLVSGAVKLLILPAAAYGVAQIIGVTGLTLQVLVLFFALPTAPSAYILARQLGGDTALMAALVTGHTLIAMATLPLVVQFVIVFGNGL